MDKKKKELIMVAALVPILGLVIYSNFIAPQEKPPPRKKKTPPAAVAAPAAAGAGKKEGKKLPPINREEEQKREDIARLAWGRDPFNPAPITQEEVNRSSNWRNFRLSGVVPGPEGGVAILDGEVIGVGEECRGYRLIRVEDRRITLEKNGQEFIIRMSEE